MRVKNNEISKNKNEIPQIPIEALKDKKEKVISDSLKVIKFLIDSPKLKKLLNQNEFSQLIDDINQYPDYIKEFLLSKISSKINNLIETSFPETKEEKVKEEKIIREYLKNFCSTEPNSYRQVLDYICSNYPETLIETYNLIEYDCSNTLSFGTKMYDIDKSLLKSFEITLVTNENLKLILENIELFYSTCKKSGKGINIFLNFLELLDLTNQENLIEIIQTLGPEKYNFLYKNILGKFITDKSYSFLTAINKTRVNEEESIQKEYSISVWEKILLGLELLKDYESNIKSIEDKDDSKKGLPPKLAQILIDRNSKVVSAINCNEFVNSNYSENLWKNLIEEFSKKAGVELTMLEVMAYIMFEINKILEEVTISHLWGKGARRKLDEYKYMPLKQYITSNRFKTSLDFYGINDDRAKEILRIAYDFFGSDTVFDEKGNILTYSPEDQIIYGFINRGEDSFHNKVTQVIYGDKKFVFDKNKIINRTTFTLYDTSELDSQTRFVHSLKYPGISILVDIFTLGGTVQDSRMLDLDYLRDIIFKDTVKDPSKHSYSEVQIHYGTSMLDVSAIYTGEYYPKDEDIQLIRSFNEANGTNISIYYMNQNINQDS